MPSSFFAIAYIASDVQMDLNVLSVDEVFPVLALMSRPVSPSKLLLQYSYKAVGSETYLACSEQSSVSLTA